MNYEELIKDLRESASDFAEFDFYGKTMAKAADAIDELQKTVKAYQQFLIFVGEEFLFVSKKEAELQAKCYTEDVNRKQTEMIKTYLPEDWGKL